MGGQEHADVKAEERDLHVMADASFPDRQGLGLREQPRAGLGHLLTGCGTKGGLWLRAAPGPGGSLPAPRGPSSWSGTGSAWLVPAAASSVTGVLEACGLVSFGLAEACPLDGVAVPPPLVLSPEAFGGACGPFSSHRHIQPEPKKPLAPTPHCGVAVSPCPCFLTVSRPPSYPGSTFHPGTWGQWEAQWLSAHQPPSLHTEKSGHQGRAPVLAPQGLKSHGARPGPKGEAQTSEGSAPDLPSSQRLPLNPGLQSQLWASTPGTQVPPF